MKCSKCEQEFPENKLDLSHDVPCYLFDGENRNEKKNQADKFGRHYLCNGCHSRYETTCLATLIKSLPKTIREELKQKAKRFSEGWFQCNKK